MSQKYPLKFPVSNRLDEICSTFDLAFPESWWLDTGPVTCTHTLQKPHEKHFRPLREKRTQVGIARTPISQHSNNPSSLFPCRVRRYHGVIQWIREAMPSSRVRRLFEWSPDRHSACLRTTHWCPERACPRDHSNIDSSAVEQYCAHPVSPSALFEECHCVSGELRAMR